MIYLLTFSQRNHKKKIILEYNKYKILQFHEAVTKMAEETN